MRVTWISGWGVAPGTLRPLAETYYPDSEHTLLAPTANAIGSLTEVPSPDVLIAWSFGAWRVLEAAARGIQFHSMVLLYAPFVAFPAESRLGGKCSQTQVRFLHRWVQRDPLAAIGDFFQRVRMMDPPMELPYPLPDLLEGLDRLSEDAPPAVREFAARGLPSNWQALIGDDDPLLNGEAVCQSLPGCVLLRGVGHSIADLLAASQA